MALPTDQAQLDAIAKCILGMCAIMRTHSDLTAEQQLDLGFIHTALIGLRQAQGADDLPAKVGEPITRGKRELPEDPMADL